jgi:hypothetical protein
VDNLNALSPLVPLHQALPLVIGAVLQGLALLLGILLAFVVLKFVVKDRHFSKLTLLVALGAVVAAIYAANLSTRDTNDLRARTLVFAQDTVTSVVFTVVPYPPLPNDNRVPPELLRSHLSALEAEAKALDDIDLKDLPSARSMDAVVAARGAARELLASARHAVDASLPVNINQSMASADKALEQLQAEVRRLYPVYGRIGPKGGWAFGTWPQQR